MELTPAPPPARRARRHAVCLAGLALALAAGFAARSGEAQMETRRYVAFGDSITRGLGDEAERGGYPGRLVTLLNAEGTSATVENEGVDGETTAEGLTRLSSVSGAAADTLLLMEGHNDVAARVSEETIAANLRAMARKGRQRGFGTVVLATLVPRKPCCGAPEDRIQAVESTTWQIRQVAYEEPLGLVDPFEVFSQTPDVYATRYADGFHPNAAGYDLLADTWADVLLGRDTVPPVPSFVQPVDGAEDVPANQRMQVVLFDLGTGIDLAATSFLFEDAPVAAEALGDSRRLRLRYAAQGPLSGRPSFGVRSRDLAAPPNTIDRAVSEFTVSGTTFLRGDIDRSGRVDGADLVILAIAFGSRRGEGRYRPIADLDDNGRIDGVDLARLAANFGRSSF